MTPSSASTCAAERSALHAAPKRLQPDGEFSAITAQSEGGSPAPNPSGPIPRVVDRRAPPDTAKRRHRYGAESYGEIGASISEVPQPPQSVSSSSDSNPTTLQTYSSSISSHRHSRRVRWQKAAAPVPSHPYSSGQGPQLGEPDPDTPIPAPPPVSPPGPLRVGPPPPPVGPGERGRGGSRRSPARVVSVPAEIRFNTDNAPKGLASLIVKPATRSRALGPPAPSELC